MRKVLWLSRHTMTTEQLDDLAHTLREEVDVVHLNVTFPARSEEAVAQVSALVKEHGVDAVAGVFPAHIAVALYEAHVSGPLLATPFFPVSVPAPAKEGEVRGGGFVHSHWE